MSHTSQGVKTADSETLLRPADNTYRDNPNVKNRSLERSSSLIYGTLNTFR